MHIVESILTAKKNHREGIHYRETRTLDNLKLDVIYVGQRQKNRGTTRIGTLKIGNKVKLTEVRLATLENITGWVKEKEHIIL